MPTEGISSSTRAAGLAATAIIAAMAACTGADERPDPTPAQRRQASLLAAPEVGQTPVRASVPGALVPGPLAMAEGQDLVLIGELGKYIFERNADRDRQDPPRPGAPILPGALVDAQGTGGGLDGLLSLTPGLQVDDGPFEPAAADEVGADKRTGGALVAVAALGGPDRRLSLTTRVVLGNGQPHLTLTTEILNESQVTLRVRPGDRLRFGTGGVFVGDEGLRDREGELRADWLGHERSPQAYGYTLDGQRAFTARMHASERGDRRPVIATDALDEPTTLAPGQRLRFVRRFLASGDGMPGVLSWLAAMRGLPLGRVEGRIASDVSSAEEFTLALSNQGNFLGHLPVRTGLGIDVTLPPGAYQITPSGPWGLRATPQNLTVAADQTSQLNIPFEDLGDVKIQILDKLTGGPLPASIVVTRKDGSPVSLGAGRRADMAGPIMHLPEGAGLLRLPAGQWRLLATRGPEYTIQTAEIVVRPGEREPASFTATLERVVSTPGWIIAQPRVYTAQGPLGAAPPEEVVKALVCAGVELASPADPWSPDVLALALQRTGLTGFLATLPALEADPLDPRAGIFSTLPADITGSFAFDRGADPASLIVAMRASASASPFVTAVWPRSPSKSGYFDRYGLDRATGTYALPQATDNFDGVEIYPGELFSMKPSNARAWFDQFAADWASFVQLGLRYTATGASGSARLGHQPVGLPFTYIQVGPGTDRTDADPSPAVNALRENKAVVSTGPLLTLDIDGLGPGTLITPRRKRPLKVRVDLVAASWMEVSTLVLYQGDKPLQQWTIPPSSDPVTRFSATLDINPEKDTWLHARAFGDKPLPTAPHLQIPPFALTNPIWIDADRSRTWQP